MKRHLSFVAALGMGFFASITAAYAQVRADTGGIAIGGSVTGSTINIGIPPEQLTALVRQAADLSEMQKKVIAKLEGELDINQRQIRAALSVLGENDIPPERLAAKLVEIAESFKALKATASAQPSDDRRIVALRTDAQNAIEAGELAKADALLAEAQAEQTRGLDRLAAADTFSRRGEIALTRLRYAEAAAHFANAAAVFPPHSSHEDERINYLQKEAHALFKQGYEFGDNGALLSAIERYKRLVYLTLREREPLVWAGSQYDLGLALLRLGERESGTAKLEEAVATFREALKEATRERAPLQWARTQIGVGVVLMGLGRRENGTARFEEAVVAYREALKEATREREPLLWANVQNGLGNALRNLGMRRSETAKLEEAVAAYREALKEWTRERVPLNWAATQNNVGITFHAIGEHGSGAPKQATKRAKDMRRRARPR